MLNDEKLVDKLIWMVSHSLYSGFASTLVCVLAAGGVMKSARQKGLLTTSTVKRGKSNNMTALIVQKIGSITKKRRLSNENVCRG